MCGARYGPGMAELSRDPAVRLRVFVDAGLLKRVPTVWQLFQGQVEMAPYVVLPDEGDGERYAGAIASHPLLRTPLVLREIGLDHFRVGHGLHARPESLYRHLNIVYHEGMPAFDLQLVQTVPNGLAELRESMEQLEHPRTAERAAQRRRIDLVLADSSAYRRKYLEPGGWIERAERFDYPSTADVAEFLRPEFTSLISFADYCARNFPAQPGEHDVRQLPGHLAGLFRKRFSRSAA